MSGHSKWATIKRDKAINDAKKGALFTKISRDLSTAAKSGGGDPTMNATLAAVITKAKAANMSNDKIQKAIDKGVGVTKSGIALSEVMYEAYGPGDVPMIVDASTDNRNRTISEVKTLIEKAGGRVVEGGAVSWMFESKGWINIPFENEEEKKKRETSKWGEKNEKQKLSKEYWQDFQLSVMDQEGVLDIQEDEEGIDIYSTPDTVGKVRKFIEDENNIYVEDSDIIKKSKTETSINDDIRERLLNLVEKLEDHDDVQKVWVALS